MAVELNKAPNAYFGITVKPPPFLEISEYVSLTIHRCEDDPGVVVGNNVCIAVLWLVDLQVGVLPGELLSWINRLTETEREQVRFYYCSTSNSFLWLKLVREQSEEPNPKKVTQPCRIYTGPFGHSLKSPSSLPPPDINKVQIQA